jgi:hypothetical protein
MIRWYDDAVTIRMGIKAIQPATRMQHKQWVASFHDLMPSRGGIFDPKDSAVASGCPVAEQPLVVGRKERFPPPHRDELTQLLHKAVNPVVSPRFNNTVEGSKSRVTAWNFSRHVAARSTKSRPYRGQVIRAKQGDLAPPYARRALAVVGRLPAFYPAKA